MNKVIQHLHSIALLQAAGERTDGQLLESFIRRREAAAIEALVHRHSPMVWGVCRRILHIHHDAEDAFQATFLVLVRKAASIKPREMVGNWLYGVAHQTALKARATKAKRQTRERQVVDMPEPAVTELGLWRDLQPILDQELSRLPDKYRVAIVLCDLEGKTRKEAARQLGCPEGTLAARLTRGRVMLAKRLAAHGLAISGGALAAVLSQQAASAGVPTSVVVSTIKAATLFAAGKTAAAGAISVKVAVLTEGMMKTMLLTKLKTVMGLLVVVAIVGFGATLIGYGTATGQQSENKKADAVAPQNKVEEADKPKTRKDEDAIQGTWVVIKIEDVNKEPLDPKGTLKMVFDGGKMTVTGRGEAKFKLDPTKKPKQMEVTAERGGETVTSLGIYTLEGDELKLCAGKDGDKEPPASFDIKDAKPEVRCVTLRRENAEAKPTEPPLPPKKEPMEKVGFTAWGKEVGGLQAGLGFRPGEHRTYHTGETVRLVVRVRNAGKEAVKFSYFNEEFYENPPAVTDDGGKPVPLDGSGSSGAKGLAKRIDVNLEQGKEVDLCTVNLVLRPMSEKGKEAPVWKLFGTGKFQLKCDRAGGSISDPETGPDPILSKLATGKLELEIKSEKPAENEKKAEGDKEAVKEPTLPKGGDAAEDIDAEMLYRAMEKKVRAAKSLQVAWDSELDSQAIKGTVKATIYATQGNKSRMEIDFDIDGKADKELFLTDGKASYWKQGDKGTLDPNPKKAEEARNLVPVMIARIGFTGFRMMRAVKQGEEKKEIIDLDKDAPVTNFKLGAKEMVGDKTAQVVTYKLDFDGASAKMSVWIDTKTQLPLKRVVVVDQDGQMFRITETCSSFAIDPKLDPKLFEIPKADPPTENDPKAKKDDAPTSLLGAIKALNTKASGDLIGKDETPITEQEVIAAIRAAERPKDSAVTDKLGSGDGVHL